MSRRNRGARQRQPERVTATRLEQGKGGESRPLAVERRLRGTADDLAPPAVPRLTLSITVLLGCDPQSPPGRDITDGSDDDVASDRPPTARPRARPARRLLPAELRGNADQVDPRIDFDWADGEPVAGAGRSGRHPLDRRARCARAGTWSFAPTPTTAFASGRRRSEDGSWQLQNLTTRGRMWSWRRPRPHQVTYFEQTGSAHRASLARSRRQPGGRPDRKPRPDTSGAETPRRRLPTGTV